MVHPPAKRCGFGESCPADASKELGDTYVYLYKCIHTDRYIDRKIKDRKKERKK